MYHRDQSSPLQFSLSRCTGHMDILSDEPLSPFSEEEREHQRMRDMQLEMKRMKDEMERLQSARAIEPSDEDEEETVRRVPTPRHVAAKRSSAKGRRKKKKARSSTAASAGQERKTPAKPGVRWQFVVNTPSESNLYADMSTESDILTSGHRFEAVTPVLRATTGETWVNAAVIHPATGRITAGYVLLSDGEHRYAEFSFR